MPSRRWFKQARIEIEQAKKDFIKSGKVGGNPFYLTKELMHDSENQEFLMRMVKKGKCTMDFYNRMMKGVK